MENQKSNESKEPLLVLVTDAHGYVKTFDKIKEIIERYKPVFVLSEDMENHKVESDFEFNQFIKKNKVSNMTPVSTVKELVKLCHKNKIKLIGIDFENFLMDRKMQTKIKRNMDFTEEEDKEYWSLVHRRENKHVKMIGKFLDISRKPVVVIVGAWHLRKGSLIRKSFGHYHLVYMADSKGGMVLGPTKERLRWGEEEL